MNIVTHFVPKMVAVVPVVFSLFLVFTITLFAQSQEFSAPVVWERYRISDREISVLLPKLPTMIPSEDRCLELVSNSYYAYADNVVYELTVTAKNANPIPKDCERKGKFNQTTLNERLGQLRADPLKNAESNVTVSTRVAKRFVNPLTTRWVFSDIEHKLWVELAISARSDAKVDQAQFISSLELSSHKGKEIGTGSPNMLGDAGVDVNKYGPVAPIPSDHYGIPNGTDRLSDGPGTGTGIGTGRGRADLGSGNGTGLGSSSKGLGVERMALGAPLHQGRTVKTKPTP